MVQGGRPAGKRSDNRRGPRRLHAVTCILLAGLFIGTALQVQASGGGQEVSPHPAGGTGRTVATGTSTYLIPSNTAAVSTTPIKSAEKARVGLQPLPAGSLAQAQTVEVMAVLAKARIDVNDAATDLTCQVDSAFGTTLNPQLNGQPLTGGIVDYCSLPDTPTLVSLGTAQASQLQSFNFVQFGVDGTGELNVGVEPSTTYRYSTIEKPDQTSTQINGGFMAYLDIVGPDQNPIPPPPTDPTPTPPTPNNQPPPAPPLTPATTGASDPVLTTPKPHTCTITWTVNDNDRLAQSWILAGTSPSALAEAEGSRVTGPGTFSYEFTDLDADAIYYFKLGLSDPQGATAPATVRSCDPTPFTTPPTVSGLQDIEVCGASRLISWNISDPSPETRSSLSYVYPGGTNTVLPDHLGTGSQHEEISGLLPAKTYTYRVDAFGADDATTHQTGSFTTSSDTTGPSVTGMSGETPGETPGETTARVHWTVSDASTNLISVLQYGAGTAPTAWETVGRFAGTGALDALIQGLVPATTYSFRVLASDCAGNTSTSAASTFTTGPATEATYPPPEACYYSVKRRPQDPLDPEHYPEVDEHYNIRLVGERIYGLESCSQAYGDAKITRFIIDWGNNVGPSTNLAPPDKFPAQLTGLDNVYTKAGDYNVKVFVEDNHGLHNKVAHGRHEAYPWQTYADIHVIDPVLTACPERGDEETVNLLVGELHSFDACQGVLPPERARHTNSGITDDYYCIEQRWNIDGAAGPWSDQLAAKNQAFSSRGRHTVIKEIRVNPTCHPILSDLAGIARYTYNVNVDFSACFSIPGQTGLATAIIGSAVTFTNCSNPESELHYTWDFGDGQTAGNVIDTAHTYTKFGTYTVTLTAYDAANNARTYVLPIYVGFNACIGARTAIIGKDIPVYNCGSSNPSNLVQFQVTAPGYTGPTSGTVVAPGLQYPTSGTRPLTLRVTDSVGTAITATTNANVTFKPCFAGIRADEILYADIDEPITLVNCSDNAPLLTYEFNYGTGQPWTPAGPFATQVQYTGPGNRDYVLRMRARDTPTGTPIEAPPLQVHIFGPNTPPSGCILADPNPTYDQTIVTLTAGCLSDDRLPIFPLSFKWDLDEDAQHEFETDWSQTPTTTKSFTSRGPHQVRLRIADARGATTTLVGTIDVINKPPEPQLTVTPNPADRGQTVIADASASHDREGPDSALKYRFQWGANGAWQPTTPTSTSTSNHVFTTPGTKDVRVEVTDVDGATATKTTPIQIRNQMPSLSYPSGTGYGTDDFDPPSGNVGTNFVFKTIYRDQDDPTPCNVQLVLDGQLQADAFTLVSGTGSSPSGATYSLTKKVAAGRHTHAIQANDCFDNIQLPAMNPINGPDVFGLHDGKVSPASGNTAQEYRFEVSFLGNNLARPDPVYLNLDNHDYPMFPVEPDQLATTGIDYFTTLKLTAAPHNFHFHTNVAGIPFADPEPALGTTYYSGPTVVRANQPPTADFHISYARDGHTVAELGAGDVLQVDASQSSDDSDRDLITYNWNWGDGTADGAGVRATHTYANPGTYMVRLRTTDADGLGPELSKTIVVAPRQILTGSTTTATLAAGNTHVYRVLIPSGTGSATFTLTPAITGLTLPSTNTALTLTAKHGSTPFTGTPDWTGQGLSAVHTLRITNPPSGWIYVGVKATGTSSSYDLRANLAASGATATTIHEHGFEAGAGSYALADGARVGPANAHRGEQVLLLPFASGNCPSATVALTTATGEYSAQAWFFLDHDVAGANLNLLRLSSGASHLATVGLLSGGDNLLDIKPAIGTTLTGLSAVPTGSWFSIRIWGSTAFGRGDVFLNDQLLAEFPFPATSPTALSLGCIAGSGPAPSAATLAIDDVIVRQGDSDADGIADRLETGIAAATRPDASRWDSDQDGLSDGEETNSHPATSAVATDTDGDGIPDGLEARLKTPPTTADQVQAGYAIGTNALVLTSLIVTTSGPPERTMEVPLIPIPDPTSGPNVAYPLAYKLTQDRPWQAYVAQQPPAANSLATADDVPCRLLAETCAISVTDDSVVGPAGNPAGYVRRPVVLGWAPSNLAKTDANPSRIMLVPDTGLLTDSPHPRAIDGVRPFPPSEPRALSVSTGLLGSANLAWAPPRWNGGASIQGYNLYKATTPSGAFSWLNTIDADATTFAISSGCLSTCIFRLTAVNSAGEGGPSNLAGTAAGTSSTLFPVESPLGDTPFTGLGIDTAMTLPDPGRVHPAATLMEGGLNLATGQFTAHVPLVHSSYGIDGMDSSVGLVYRTQTHEQNFVGHNWYLTANRRIDVDLLGNAIVSDGGGQFDLYPWSTTTLAFTTPTGLQNKLTKTADGGHLLEYAWGIQETFDAQGNRTSVTDPLGNSVAYSYDDFGRPSTVIDPFGRLTHFTYQGMRLSTVEVNGIPVAQLGYDEAGDLVTIFHPGYEGSASTGQILRYDAQHNLLSATDERGIQYLTNTYDSVGRVATQSRASGDAEASASFGSRANMMEAAAAGGDSGGGSDSISSSWNAAGTVNTVTDANGNIQVLTFDTSQHKHLLSKEWQTNRDIQADAPAVFLESYTYTGDDRTGLTRPDGSGWRMTFLGGSDETTSHLPTTRDEFSSVTSDPVHRTSWTYRSDARLLAMTEVVGNDATYVPQNGGTWSSARYTTKWLYSENETATGTDLNGDGTIGGPDGRPAKIVYPSPTPDAATPGGAGIAGAVERSEILIFNPQGQLVGRKTADGTLSLNGYIAGGEADGAGQPEFTMTKSVSGATPDQQVSFTYDGLGKMATSTDLAGRVTRYTWDGDHIATLTSPFGLQKQTFEHGRVISIDRADARENEDGTWPADGTFAVIHQDIRRDAHGRVYETETDTTNPAVGPSSMKDRYFYDGNGNPVVHQYHSSLTGYNFNAVETAVYDERNQLISTTVGGWDPLLRVHPVDNISWADPVPGKDPTALFLHGTGTSSKPMDEAPPTATATTSISPTAAGGVWEWTASGPTMFAGVNPQVVFWMSDTAAGTSSTWNARLLADGGTVVASTPAGGVTFAGGAANAPVQHRLSLGHSTFTASALRLEISSTSTSGRNLLVNAIATPSYLSLGSGQTTTYAYDSGGRLAKIIDPNGGETTYAYDGYGRPTTTTGPFGTSVVTTYDAADRVVKRETYGAKSGIASDSSAPATTLLARWEARYDEAGNLYRTDEAAFDIATGTNLPDTGITPSDGKVTTFYRYDRDSTGPYVKVTKDDASTTTTYSNGLGQVARIIDPAGNEQRYTYDAVGRMLSSIARENRASGAVDFTTSYTYAGLDAPRTQTNPTGHTRAYRYDSLSNPVELRDATGMASGGSAPVSHGNKTLRFYDHAGRMVSSSTSVGYGVDSLDDAAIVVQQAWNMDGQLASITNVDIGTTSYVYDSRGNLVAEFLPGNHTNTYGYDASGNLVERRDADDILIQARYSVAGDLLERTATWPLGSLPSSLQSFEYDGLGRPTRAGDNNAIGAADDSLVLRTYDSLGRLQVENQNGNQVTHTYDGAGHLTRLGYPNGRILDRTYNQGRLVALGDGGAAHTLYTYTGSMPAARDNPGVIKAQYTYDDALRIKDINFARPGAHPVFIGLHYGYDGESNPTSIRLDHAPSYSLTAQYDAAQRLHGVTRAKPSGVTEPVAPIPGLLRGEETWFIDGGNQIRGHDSGGSAAYEYGEPGAEGRIDRITDGTTGEKFNYMQSGKRINDKQNRYTYDAYGRLTQSQSIAGTAPTVTYTYDAFDRRVTKNPGQAIRFIYDGADVIQEQKASGQLLRQYVHGDQVDMPVLMDRNMDFDATTNGAGDQRLYYAQDAQGSTVALVNGLSQVVEGYLYTAYGDPVILRPSSSPEVTWGSGSATDPTQTSLYENPYLYTGQRWDQETRLYDYRARIYDPVAGQFLTRDPIGAWGDGLGAGNAYAYVGNNPLAMRDPSGLFGVCNIPGIAAGCWAKDRVNEIVHEGTFCGGLDSWSDYGCLATGIIPLAAPGVAEGVVDTIHALWADAYCLSPSTSGDACEQEMCGTGARILWNAVMCDGDLDAQGLLCAGMSQSDTALCYTQVSLNMASTALLVAGGIGAGVSRIAALEAGAGLGPGVGAKPPTLPAYAGGKTSGVLRIGADDIALTSGRAGPAAGLPPGTRGMNGLVKTHVEGHAAALMRQQGVSDATLYINRIPCGVPPGCNAMLPSMLPPGARLRVVGPEGFDYTYVGRP